MGRERLTAGVFLLGKISVREGKNNQNTVMILVLQNEDFWVTPFTVWQITICKGYRQMLLEMF
jgi:hypothetical protein